ncbi:hypothetical protein Pmani_030375 [Petrolisthes manimaculis]|uniref:Uncharacterized protein n=1 Tax=Petrolisthes manimaculis TaxID=1843537 RepID=A0AAE1TW05_9EUCA|nr:hypothetical protein Pmani_030375 [Petrolisthes manimaculis]
MEIMMLKLSCYKGRLGNTASVTNPASRTPSSSANPLEDLVNRLKPDRMSGRAMKYPYTFSAKLAAFPYQMYIKHVWLFRYYAAGLLISAPIFYKIQKMSCSPENVAKFEAKRLAEQAEHH